MGHAAIAKRLLSSWTAATLGLRLSPLFCYEAARPLRTVGAEKDFATPLAADCLRSASPNAD
jgi:hypothetical protein